MVIGHLNPDGSLGPVSHMLERLNAAAEAGMTRAIIPSVQRFDTDSSGQPVNMIRHGAEGIDVEEQCEAGYSEQRADDARRADPGPSRST